MPLDPETTDVPADAPHPEGGVLVARISSKGKWEGRVAGSPIPERVLDDFQLREGESGLSFYQIRDAEEAKRLACVFSLTLRDNPCHFDYVTVAKDDLARFQLAPVPVEEHHPFLAERHCEIQGPDTQRCREIAGTYWSSPRAPCRIKMQEIVDYAIENGLDSDPDFSERIAPRWRDEIQKTRAKQGKKGK